MWQLEWAATPPTLDLAQRPPGPRAEIGGRQPKRVGGLMWEDHCHECAEPDCYATCPLYARRGDGRCARLEYGIYPNPAFDGLFPFGADVNFRRWGKLESVLPVGRLSVGSARRLARLDHALVASARQVDRLRRWPDRRQATSAYRSVRINSLRAAPRVDFDEFVIEAFSPETDEFKLVVECKRDGTPYFRESVVIAPGWNRVAMPAAPLLAGATDRTARLLVYPENDATVRVVFTWLDLVTYASSTSSPSSAANRSVADASSSGEPASTVKCVVWDLDNTLWTGILADLGPDELTLAEGVRDMIDQLDERGILQSIASKNDHDDAWRVIERLGLDQMFLHPAIHWGPKSESIRSIANALNIGVDTLAFIDDSEVERAQVKSELPQVRVYSELELDRLLGLDEFDVQPSAEGRRRRLSYLAEAERQAVFSSSSDVPIDAFLRSSAIEVDLSIPSDEATVDRCHELLLRSNQLNLSTRRFSRRELEELIEDPTRTAVTVSVRDRFGDYGLVGFLSFRYTSGRVLLDDLVLSCRVAKKYVENAALEALRTGCGTGASAIEMTFVPTARNRPLLDALRTAGAVGEATDPGGAINLRIGEDEVVPFSDVVATTSMSRR